MLASLRSVVENVETNSALDRLRAQGQEFSRAYYEFVLLKDLAYTHSIVRKEWDRLNKMANFAKTNIGLLNSKIDSINSFSRSVFGEDLSSIGGDFLNAYILCSISPLKFVTQSLSNFNRSIILPSLKSATMQ